MNRLAIFAVGTLVLSIVLDIVFNLGYGSFWWSKVPGFFAVFGFFGCIAIILGSKLLGKFWLKKKEHYYSDFQGEGDNG